MSTTDRAPFQKLRAGETCEACGHKGWCMHSEATIYCMRNPDGAYATRTDKAGLPVYLHHRTGIPAAEPYRAPRDERPNWAATNPASCALLYTLIATDFAAAEPPAAALAADERRFGDHAATVQAIQDVCYLADPAGLVRRLAAEGRTQDAKNAGILYPDGHNRAGQLVTWLKHRKLHLWRDERGQVRDIRGRALDASTPKVIALAGSREERGADAVWYQHRHLAACAGHIRIAGGHEKCDALNVAGIPAIGSNEGQASDAMIAAAVASSVYLVTLHIDGEDPKDGKAISEGQRLGLALGARLEAAGICVRVAEPLRSPGEPKLDADTILRDHGPDALRDIDRRAVSLAAFRRRLGLGPPDADPDHVRRLQEAVREARDERDQAQEWNRLTFMALRAGHGMAGSRKVRGQARALCRSSLGLLLEWDARRHQGQDVLIDEDGQRYFHVDYTAAGENVGTEDDAPQAGAAYLCDHGLARKIVKTVPRENPAPGEYPFYRKVYLHFPFATKEDALAAIVAHQPAEPEPKPAPPPPEEAACPACGGTETRTIVVCADCGHELAAEVKPKVSVIEDTSLGEAPPTPAPEAEVKPKVSVLPPDAPWRRPDHLPWCLNHLPEGRGCQQRVEEQGAHYCRECRVAKGYTDPFYAAPAAAVADRTRGGEV